MRLPRSLWFAICAFALLPSLACFSTEFEEPKSAEIDAAAFRDPNAQAASAGGGGGSGGGGGGGTAGRADAGASDATGADAGVTKEDGDGGSSDVRSDLRPASD